LNYSVCLWLVEPEQLPVVGGEAGCHGAGAFSVLGSVGRSTAAQRCCCRRGGVRRSGERGDLIKQLIKICIKIQLKNNFIIT
jgi:hypothetical protein